MGTPNLLTTWIVGGYVVDVLIRPALAAQRARTAADRQGKPLLNVGAGTDGSSLRAFLFGPTLWGDVNIDLAGSGPHGPHNVSHGDACDLSRWPDDFFGATIASHVVEHVHDPERAEAEMRRVTSGPVFILTPLGCWAHAWTHPGHQWFRNSRREYRRLWRPPPGQD